MANNLPFFPNYPVDWIMSEKVACMKLHEVGAYKLLIDHQWMGVECTLPDDLVRLKALVKWEDVTHGDFSRVLACFPRVRTPKGRRGNARLLEEYVKALAKHGEAVARGVKGAASRWATNLVTTTPSTHPPTLNGRDYPAESKEILAFLNVKTGKHFREVEANLSIITARLKSGIDVQTCKTLIARKVRDWTPKPEMVGYLRPETLFNKTKFETYLAEVTA